MPMKAVQPPTTPLRIGLCIDVGHCCWLSGEPTRWRRSAIAIEHLYEVHLKGQQRTRGQGRRSAIRSPAVVGHGALDFKAIMAALVDVKFAHQAEFEYEKKATNKVPGLAESVGYVRGLLAAG